MDVTDIPTIVGRDQILSILYTHYSINSSQDWSQQEYVNRDQGFSQGYSECSVGHMKLGFPFQYFSYLKC
jgi:hypothetical protein